MPTELKEIGEHPDGGKVFLNDDEYILLKGSTLYSIDEKEAKKSVGFVSAMELMNREKEEPGPSGRCYFTSQRLRSCSRCIL